MNNILPELKVAKYHGASSSARKASFSEWVPSDANGITGSIPSYIETEFTKVDNHEGKFKENKLPVEEPNERHIDTRKVALLQPSPLGITERGVTEEPRIVFEPPEPLNKTQNTIVIEANTRYVHLLRMINYLPTYMDLYTQKKLTMLHSIVNPSSYSVRLLSGKSTITKRAEEDMISVLFATIKRATATITTRQEIKDYVFQAGQQIGLEVEIINHRIVCSKVIPETQAAQYSKYLESSEIIAVNGHRVITLNDFQERVSTAHNTAPSVVLTIASFIGGKQKLDELFLHDFGKNNNVKSLLSNIFSSGLKSSSAGDGSVASGFSEETDELDDDTSTDGGTDRGENELEGVSNESLLAGEKGLSTEYSSHIVKAEFDLSVDADEKDTYKLMYKSEKDSKHNVEESKNYLDQLIADRAESKDYSNEDIEHSQLYGDPVNVSSVDEDAIVAGKYDSVTVDASNESDRYVIGEISESIKEEKVKKKKKEKNDWNYTTKTKKSSAIIPFLVLVCVPNFLQHSLGWGQPKKYIQFTNYSTSWNIEINWVNENGHLKMRKIIKPGAAHFELTCNDHVWALLATSATKHKNDSGLEAIDKFYSDEEIVHGAGNSPVTLILRPSISSTTSNKCVSVLWSPWVSMSVSEREHTIRDVRKLQPISLKTKHFQTSEIAPNIHVQVLEGNIALQSESVDTSTLAGGPTPTIKLPHWPPKHGRLVKNK